MSILLDDALTTVKIIQAVMSVPRKLSQGTSDFALVSGAVSGAENMISFNLSAADAVMQNLLLSANDLIAGPDGNGAVSSLTSISSAAQDLAGLTAMRGYAGRMAANLENASS